MCSGLAPACRVSCNDLESLYITKRKRIVRYPWRTYEKKALDGAGVETKGLEDEPVRHHARAVVAGKIACIAMAETPKASRFVAKPRIKACATMLSESPRNLMLIGTL